MLGGVIADQKFFREVLPRAGDADRHNTAIRKAEGEGTCLTVKIGRRDVKRKSNILLAGFYEAAEVRARRRSRHRGDFLPINQHVDIKGVAAIEMNGPTACHAVFVKIDQSTEW